MVKIMSVMLALVAIIYCSFTIAYGVPPRTNDGGNLKEGSGSTKSVIRERMVTYEVKTVSSRHRVASVPEKDSAPNDIVTKCPKGFRAVGGGFDLAEGENNGFGLVGSSPTKDGLAWKVRITGLKKGSVIETYAICFTDRQ